MSIWQLLVMSICRVFVMCRESQTLIPERNICLSLIGGIAFLAMRSFVTMLAWTKNKAGESFMSTYLNTVKSREPRSQEESEAFDDEDIELFEIEDLEAFIDNMEMPPREDDEDEPIEPIVYFVNSSIQQLAMCWLLAARYAKFVETEEVWNNDVLRNKYAALWAEEIRRADAGALEEGDEWADRVHRVRRGLVS